MSTAYGYDPVSRLASLADDLVGTANDVASSFAWNPASQMIRKVRDNDGYGFTASVDVDRDYGVNGLNQYVSAGPAAFSYDANGNLTSDGATTYSYDVENRLVTASGASAATMVWDPKGRLYQTGGGGFGATQYLYDGDELLVEYTTTGTIRRRYVHGPGDDDPMIWYEGATLTDQRSLQTDPQGSVVSVADASGALVAINAYDEYGIPQNSLTGATEPQGRFAYTGQAWIPELGMYHYKARIYSPTLGRFLQTDPIGYDDQFNLYAYVRSDPVNGRDPSGLSCTSNADMKGVTCKIDVTNDLKGKALDRANRIYTRSVNRLLSHTNKMVRISAVGSTGNAISRSVKSSDVAESLISANVSYGGDSASYPDGGQQYINLASTTSGPSGPNITIFSRLLGKSDGEIGKRLVHEGIHPTEANKTLMQQSNSYNFLRALSGAPSYNVSHQDSFNVAAGQLLEENK